MYFRQIERELKNLVKDYPVVTVIGPRQSGKTTLVQHAFPTKAYVNLENPDTRLLAGSDPRGFLGKFKEGVIIDEVQRVPDLLSYIQVIVDNTEAKGMFILTGSHQLELHQAISQSLAGRTALLTLLPMSIDELLEVDIELSINQYLLRGGFPRIYKDQLDPYKAYRNYFQTYVERDVRQLSNVKDLMQFEKFIRICAGRVGQILNLESIGGEVGISSHTVKEWLSILEASFILFRLSPYFENFGKRMIKSPKIYFTDVGLVTYLLGIENENQISRDPLRSHLVENLIFLELLKYRYNHGLDSQLYYYRDVRKNEVDIIFKNGNDLIPIEIKSGETFHKDFLQGLLFFQELVGERAPKGYVIYTGEQEQSIGKNFLLNFRHSKQAILTQN